MCPVWGKNCYLPFPGFLSYMQTINRLLPKPPASSDNCLINGEDIKQAGLHWLPFLRKGTGEWIPTTSGITLLGLRGKVYSRVLERSLRLIVKPRIQEEQCCFHPGCETVDQIFSLAEWLRGSWELDHPVFKCFVDSEKAYNRVPWGIWWGPYAEGVWSTGIALVRYSVIV